MDKKRIFSIFNVGMDHLGLAGVAYEAQYDSDTLTLRFMLSANAASIAMMIVHNHPRFPLP